MKKVVLLCLTVTLFLFTGIFSANAIVRNVPSGTYPTIQSAINAALPGDVIQVAAGVYAESLDFTGHPGVTLQGLGIGSTIIQAIAPGVPASSPPCAIWVPESNVKLVGFTLNGLGKGNTTNPRRGIKFQGTLSLPVFNSLVNEIEVMNFDRTGLEFFLCNNSTIGFPLTGSVRLHDNGGRGLSLVVVNGALVQGLSTWNNEWCGMAVQSRNEPAYLPGISTGVVITGPNSFNENFWVNSSGQINGGLMTEQDAAGLPVTVGCTSFFDVFLNPVDFSFGLTWIPSPSGYPQARFFQTYAQALAAVPAPVPTGFTPDIRQLCGPITTVVSQTACPNSIVSVPIIVSEGYNNLGLISLMLLYDQAVLEYQSAVVDPGIAGAFTNGTAGVFTLSYISPNPIILNSTTLVTVNFVVKSCSNTGITNLTWAYNPSGVFPPDLSSNEYAPPYSALTPAPYYQDPFGKYFVAGTVNVDDQLPPVINCPAAITQATDPNVCTALVNFMPAATFSIPPVQNAGAYSGCNDLWQSFKATQTGILTGIDVTTYSTNNTAWIIKVFAGEGTGGCLLYSGTYTPSGVGLQSIPIPKSAGVYLENTKKYTFSLTGNSTVGCVTNVDVVCTFAPPVSYADGIYWDNTYPVCQNSYLMPYAGGTVNAAFKIDQLPAGMTLSDNCAVRKLVASPESGSTFALGSTTVTFTATDFCVNTASCSFTVTVVDLTPPTISCAVPDASYNTDPNVCTIAVPDNSLDPTATGDNCNVATVSNNFNNSATLLGATFPKGLTNVIWTVTDVNGLSATCSYSVVVVDNQVPVITRNGDATFEICEGAIYADLGATATDNCDPVVTVNTNNPVNTSIPATYTVTYTAQDLAGNNATPVTRTVIVKPLPVVQSCDLQYSSDGTYWTSMNDTWPSYDMCLDKSLNYLLDVNTMVLNPLNLYVGTLNAFTLAATSNTPAFLAYWAGKGVDGGGPYGDWRDHMWLIINGWAPFFYVKDNGSDIILVDGLQYFLAGNTGEPFLSLPGDYPELSYTYSGTLKGANGCASLPLNVFMTFYSIPVITCPADIVVGNTPGLCSASVAFAANATAVPAAGFTYTIGAPPVVITSPYTFPVGTTVVTATATNSCGSDVCTFKITVNDTEQPNITCAAPAASYNADPGLCSFKVIGTPPSGFVNPKIDHFWIAINQSYTIEPPSGGWPVDEPGEDGLWYLYDQILPPWYNIWFYDHPLDLNRMKVIRMGFWVRTLDPMVPGIINYVVNWSTPGWVDPGFPKPPDEAYIMRSPVNAIPVMPGPPNPNGQWVEMYYVIPDYNPEWVSIDLWGSNIIIEQIPIPPPVTSPLYQWWLQNPGPGGILVHECLPKHLPGTFLDPTFTGDNCGVASVTNSFNGLNTLDGAVFNVGTTNVVWTVTDVNGLSSTCGYDVVVVDNQPPTITCAIPANPYNADPGKCTYTVPGIALDPTATGDNCGVASVKNNFNNSATLLGAIFPVGNTSVIWTVTDINGLTATCNYNVVVVDNQPPTITCATPANPYSNCNIGACYACIYDNSLDPTATGDNCNVSTVINNYNNSNTLNGATFPVGTTNVIWTVTDVNGLTATCSYSVIVSSNPPQISCPTPDNPYNTDPGICNYTVVGTDLDPYDIWDDCGIVSVVNSYNGANTLNGAVFFVGTTNVTWTITNVNGQSSSCSYSVVVVDNQSPSITCAAPAASYNADPGLCSFKVIGTPPSGFVNPKIDHFWIAINQSYTIEPPSGGWPVDEPGEDGLWYLYDQIIPPWYNIWFYDHPLDLNRMKVIRMGFWVRTLDPMVPGIINYVVNWSTPGWVDPGFPKPPDEAYIMRSPVNAIPVMPGPPNPNGQWVEMYYVIPDYNPEWVSIDLWGSNIIIEQIPIPPPVTSPLYQWWLQNPGPGGILVHECLPKHLPGTFLDPTFTGDNCGVASVTNSFNGLNTLDGAVFNVGTTNVVWTVTDVNGLSSTCSYDVVVVDNQPPVIVTCGPAQSAFADGNCQAPVPDFTITTVATDNCGPVTITQVPLPLTLVGLGVTPVVINVTDGSGLSATCNTNFTVTDNTAPVLAAAPAALSVQCIGDVPAMTSLSWTDNCDAGGSVAGVDGLLVGGACGGTITRTWNVSDAYGNPATTRTQIITVNDNTAPVLKQNATIPPGGTLLDLCFNAIPAGPSAADIATLYEDNCGGAINVTKTGTPSGDDCSWTVTYSFEVKDNCGNIVNPSTQQPCFNTPDGTDLFGWKYKDYVIPVGYKIDSVYMDAVRPYEIPAHYDFIFKYCPGITSYNPSVAITLLDYTAITTSMYNVWLSLINDQVQATGMVRVSLPPYVNGGTTWNNLCFAISPIINPSLTVTYSGGDKTPPTITYCPVDIEVHMNSGCGATGVNLGTLTATDNCGGSVSISNDAPTLFPEGETTVTWTIKDACLNPTTCTQKVTVVRNTLSGTLKYNNLAKTPMNHVKLRLVETGATSTTLTDGNYVFTSLCSGTYTIVVDSNYKPVGGINSTDAGAVNAWFTNTPVIEYVKFYAGDVNANNFINANDALRIQQYFVFGTPFGRPAWTYWMKGDVTPSPPNPPLGCNIPSVNPFGVITITGNVTNFDFYALCTGDFNGSFTPNAAKAANSSLSLTNNGNTYVGANQEFELPLRVASSMEVGAVSLILDIPSDLVEVTGVSVSGSTEPVSYTVNGNELRIGWNSVTPVNIPTGSNLLILKLRTTEAFTAGKSIAISLIGDPLNELADGSFDLIGNAVLEVDVIDNLAVGTGRTDANALSLSNHPNPFSNLTTLTYTLPVDGKVVLEVNTILGQKLRTLVDENQTAGKYSLEFNGQALQQGIYIFRLRLTNDGVNLERAIKFVIQK